MATRYGIKAAAAVLVGAALVAAGCGSNDSKSSAKQDTSKKSDTSMQSDTSTTDTTDASMSSTSSPAGKYASSKAADTRITLDRLLAEHALLADVALQKVVDGSKDTANVVKALDANTDDLGDVVGSVYGKDAQQAFEAQWRAHIGFFADYATAVAKGDKAGQAKAKASLAGYQKSFSQFMAKATGAPAPAVAAALQMHVNQLIGAVDSYKAGTYTDAYGKVRMSYAHMYDTADALAGAIATQQKLDNGEVTDAAIGLRQTLDKQLGEHAFLAFQAMQHGYDGKKDFPAAGAALAANTDDLTASISSVFGDAAGKAFKTQWAAHNGDFVNYTVSSAKKDEQGKQAALKALGDYEKNFGSFLATATGLPADAVQGVLKMHVDQTQATLDDYVAGDYDKAYADWREGYAHMFAIGDTLTGAIVAKMPDKFAS
jgi:hypothetical protein